MSHSPEYPQALACSKNPRYLLDKLVGGQVDACVNAWIDRKTDGWMVGWEAG